jgi:uncharacterized protein
MKYLLVLAVVLVAVWVWRNNRQLDRTAPPPRRTARRTPTPMVACLHCGTHLPEHEAIQGPRGVYCCAEHRRQHEDTGGAA